jgi:hypothetical protein
VFSRSCWRLVRCPAWTQSHHVHGLPAKRSLTESGCLAPPTAGTGRQKVNEAYHGTRGESAAPIETVAGRERARAVSAPGGGSCRERVAEGDERGRPSPDGRRSEYKVQGQWALHPGFCFVTLALRRGAFACRSPSRTERTTSSAPQCRADGLRMERCASPCYWRRHRDNPSVDCGHADRCAAV